MNQVYTKKDAIELIDAARHREGWVYYAPETDEWVAFDNDDLKFLIQCMNDEDPQVSGDAYSHWCCGVGRKVTSRHEIAEITGEEVSMFEIYYVDCGFDGFYMKVNLEQDKAPISMYCGPDAPDEETCWEATQYQTADARHDADRAAILCVQECGKDWYCAPGESVSAKSVIKSVTEVSDGTT